MQLTSNQEQVIKDVADELGIKNSDWLRALIKAESNFNPVAANPNSSAKGLIQFIDSTARGLGFANSADLVDRYPDFESQLRGPVKQYLLTYAPFPTEQSLYMSVFLPKYRNSDPDTVLEEKYRKANPGIDTVADYLYYVKNHKLPSKKKSLLNPTFTAFACVGLWYLLRKMQ